MDASPKRFNAQHSNGSSGGKSRVIRSGYAQATYVEMIKEAHQMWSKLEEESNTQLIIRSGVVQFGCKGNVGLKSIIDNLLKDNISHTILHGKEINQMYGKQLCLPDDYQCVLENDEGIICAAEAVLAYQTMFISAGGDMRDMEHVTEIEPGEEIVVKTAKSSFKTKKLVITAGPWAPTVLKPLGLDLPLKVLNTEVLYWKLESPEDFTPHKFPCVNWLDDDNETGFCSYYGIPVLDHPGLIKICYHGELETDSDSCDSSGYSSVERTSKFISTFLKGVSDEPTKLERCMYTMTPDCHPILDRHPQHPNIIIGAGFSGHGFKLSPVVGKVLSEMCLGLNLSSYDLSMFSINRF